MVFFLFVWMPSVALAVWHVGKNPNRPVSDWNLQNIQQSFEPCLALWCPFCVLGVGDTEKFWIDQIPSKYEAMIPILFIFKYLWQGHPVCYLLCTLLCLSGRTWTFQVWICFPVHQCLCLCVFVTLFGYMVSLSEVCFSEQAGNVFSSFVQRHTQQHCVKKSQKEVLLKTPFFSFSSQFLVMIPTLLVSISPCLFNSLLSVSSSIFPCYITFFFYFLKAFVHFSRELPTCCAAWRKQEFSICGL